MIVVKTVVGITHLYEKIVIACLLGLI